MIGRDRECQRPRAEDQSTVHQPIALQNIESVIESALISEREYWSECYLGEVRKVERSVSAVQHRADADKADVEAVRASVRDMRAEFECSSAVGATRLSLLEAAVSELRDEREQLRGELRRAEERSLAEVAALRASHEGALGAHREALESEREQRRGELRRAEERSLAEIAALRASHEGALGAAVREALESEWEQRRGELRRVEERSLAEMAALRATHESALSAAAREGDGSLTGEAVAELMSEVSKLKAAAAEGPEDSSWRLRQLSEGLEQVRSSADAAHRRLSELALGQVKACERLSCLDDTQTQVLATQGIIDALAGSLRQSRGDLTQTQETVEELRAEVRSLCAGRDGRAQDVDLRAVGSRQPHTDTDPGQADPGPGTGAYPEELGADGTAAGREPEGPRAAELGANGAAEQRAAAPAAGALSSGGPARPRAVCERAADLETRMAAATAAARREEGLPAQDVLPTLLTSGGAAARRAGVGPADAKPPGAKCKADGAAADAEVAAAVSPGLKEGGDAQRAAAPPLAGQPQGAAAVPVLRLPVGVWSAAACDQPLSARCQRPQTAAAACDQPLSARVQRPQSQAVPAGQPLRLLPLGPAQAAARPAVVQRGRSMQVAPGPPLLVRRP